MAKDSTFRERLKEARERNGWTQAEVGTWSDLPAGSVAQYEMGKRSPSTENLRKLAKGLRVSSDWLLGLA